MTAVECRVTHVYKQVLLVLVEWGGAALEYNFLFFWAQPSIMELKLILQIRK